MSKRLKLNWRNKPVIVYGLASSENLFVRYIGQSCNLPSRISNHRTARRKSPDHYLSGWMQQVVDGGFELVVVRLQENAVRDISEINLIRRYRTQETSPELKLLNHSSGRGSCGYKWTDEQRRNEADRRKKAKLRWQH